MREDDTSEDRPNGAGIGQTVMSLPRKRNRNLKNKVGYHGVQFGRIFGVFNKPWCRILFLSVHFHMHIVTSRFSLIRLHCQPALSSEVSPTSKSGYFCAKLTGFDQ